MVNVNINPKSDPCIIYTFVAIQINEIKGVNRALFGKKVDLKLNRNGGEKKKRKEKVRRFFERLSIVGCFDWNYRNDFKMNGEV